MRATANPQYVAFRQAQGSIMVPAYQFPTLGTFWATATAAAPTVRYIVADPANGPGVTADANYTAVITAAQAAGIKVLGYVNTQFATVPLATAEAQVTTWNTLYPGVTSMFFDNASTVAGNEASYYAPLCAQVHAVPGAVTVLNFGTIPDQGYMAFTDVAILFENDYTVFRPGVISQVQQASGTVANSLTVPVTLPRPTGAGNTLIAAVFSWNSGSVADLTGITVGGSADHWGGTGASTITSPVDALWSVWTDPNCAGGQTSVSITAPGAAGAGQGLAAVVWEFEGIIVPRDQVTAANGTSTSWTSGTSGTTVIANELFVGFTGGESAAAATLTGPGGWVNTGTVSQAISGGSLAAMAGYRIVTSPGTVTYSGTSTQSLTFGALGFSFEQSGFQAGSVVPSWVGTYAANRFAALVFNVPATCNGQFMQSAMAQALAANCGVLYMTDQTNAGGNPYGATPLYFGTEVATLAAR